MKALPQRRTSIYGESYWTCTKVIQMLHIDEPKAMPTMKVTFVPIYWLHMQHNASIYNQTQNGAQITKIGKSLVPKYNA